MNPAFKRSLSAKNNRNSRIIGIKGPHGAGKTTMPVQRIKEKYASPEGTPYMSLDHSLGLCKH